MSSNTISKLGHHKRRHSLWLPSPSNCWTADEPELVSYDPSRDKVSLNIHDLFAHCFKKSDACVIV